LLENKIKTTSQDNKTYSLAKMTRHLVEKPSTPTTSIAYKSNLIATVAMLETSYNNIVIATCDYNINNTICNWIRR
jgi:hypothetical protein